MNDNQHSEAHGRDFDGMDHSLENLARARKILAREGREFTVEHRADDDSYPWAENPYCAMVPTEAGGREGSYGRTEAMAIVGLAWLLTSPVAVRISWQVPDPAEWWKGGE